MYTLKARSFCNTLITCVHNVKLYNVNYINPSIIDIYYSRRISIYHVCIYNKYVLRTQNEQILNAEATRQSQCSDLENQVHVSRGALLQMKATLAKVKCQLQKVGCGVSLVCLGMI